MPRKPSSYLKESCSAPGKEGIPGSLNVHCATDSFGLEKIEDLKNQTCMRKPKQVREVVHVGNKSFEI